jgi:hypothetical protein
MTETKRFNPIISLTMTHYPAYVHRLLIFTFSWKSLSTCRTYFVLSRRKYEINLKFQNLYQKVRNKQKK